MSNYNSTIVLNLKKVVCPPWVGEENVPAGGVQVSWGLHEEDGAWHQQAGGCDSGVVAVPICHGEERANPKDKAVDLLVNLRLHPQLWS